jgi:hypothetical protein
MKEVRDIQEMRNMRRKAPKQPCITEEGKRDLCDKKVAPAEEDKKR